jgi:hypothetical protein
MPRTRLARTVLWPSAVLLVIAGLSSLSGCGNPTASVSRCLGAPDATVAAIQQRLTVSGDLRNGKMVKPQVPDGFTMVSAELHPTHADKHDKGDILTWATRDPTHDDFVSVDAHARNDSAWPHASFGVAEKGAIESRACTGLNVGKTKAQLECEQNPGNSNVGIGGNDCSKR